MIINKCYSLICDGGIARITFRHLNTLSLGIVVTKTVSKMIDSIFDLKGNDDHLNHRHFERSSVLVC